MSMIISVSTSSEVLSKQLFSQICRMEVASKVLTAPFLHLASRLRLWRCRTYKSESDIENIKNTSLLVIFRF